MIVTLCIQSAHVFLAHSRRGPIASRVDVGINRARDYSLTHSYTRLRAQSKYYAHGVGLTIRSANKTARNRLSGETFLRAIKVACPPWPCCQLSVYLIMRVHVHRITRAKIENDDTARLIMRSWQPTSVYHYIYAFLKAAMRTHQRLARSW